MNLNYPQENHARISAGSYTLTIDASGFKRAVKSFHTKQQYGIVAVCLSVGGVVPGEQLSLLRGSVGEEYLGGDEPAWVRLVGMYVDYNSTALVDGRGSFAFRRLQPGHYQLMLFKGGQVKYSQEVDVRALDNEVTIK